MGASATMIPALFAALLSCPAGAAECTVPSTADRPPRKVIVGAAITPTFPAKLGDCAQASVSQHFQLRGVREGKATPAALFDPRLGDFVQTAMGPVSIERLHNNMPSN